MVVIDRLKAFFVLFVLILLTCFSGFAQPEALTGLRFASHEVIKDKRTSLNLTPGSPLAFSEGFEVEFDAAFRPGDGYYGYVFRIIGDRKTSIDLVANLGESSPTKFSLILESEVLFSYTWDDIPNGAFGKWTKVKLIIDSKKSKISLFLNGSGKTKTVEFLSGLKKFAIVFGACKDISFLTTDVAPMTLRNIRVYDGKKELIRNWELSKHSNSVVYDEVISAPATASNPIWEINKHMEWAKEGTFHIPNLIGLAENKITGSVFLVSDQALYDYDPISGHIDTLEYAFGSPYHCDGNQILHNQYTNSLISYNFDNDKVSVFDFETKSWSTNDLACTEPAYWLHNQFISSADSSLTTFGGYGFYKYNSVIKKHTASQGWTETILKDKIHPRYMSALGIDDDNKMLVFGGYGSKSGRQELSPEFYYDLHKIDPQTMDVEKIWTLDSINTPFVPCNSMVIDQEGQGFYTLVYNPGNFQTSARLAHFDLDNPEWEYYADSISYKFLDTRSWSSLYLNTKGNILIAVTKNDSEVNFHSLAYPPLLKEEVYQKPPSDTRELSAWMIILLVILGLASGMTVFIIRFRQKKNTVGTAEPGTEHLPPTLAKADPKVSTSAIYLLGGFLMYDQNGEDITSTLTPTLKKLFLLIFLSSMKNGKGVSSVMLNDTLWFDKTGTSARNNRNVNISKLRGLLEKVGNVSLENNRTYWKITFGEDIYCDYTRVIKLMEKASTAEGLALQEIQELIGLASSGNICPNVQTEWMDEFKASFANSTIDTLVLIANSSDHTKNNYGLLCDIADCILKYDSINEEGIRLKCSSLYKMGKKGLAKHSFNSFSREYKSLLGDELTLSFNKLIEH